MRLYGSLYELLGVRQNADDQEILAAFQNRLREADAQGWRGVLARLVGPERSSLERAKDTLLDPQLRAGHDKKLKYSLPLCPPA
jgi:hypothetical protein